MMMLIMALVWALMAVSSDSFANDDVPLEPIPPDRIIVRWDASTTTPKIGEPIQFMLTVDYGADVHDFNWDIITPQWGDFELLSRDGLYVSQGQQKNLFKAVLWQVGDFQTPDLTVSYYVKGDDRIHTISPDRLSFSVQSVIAPDETVVLRGNTSPIQTFYIPEWLYLLAVLMVMGVVAVGYYVLKNRRKPIEDDMGAPLADVWRGKSQNELKRSIAPIKDYISQKLGYSVNSLTHDELIQRLKQHQVVSARQLARLEQLLAKYDYYKFSAEESNADLVAHFRGHAERWVAMTINEAEQV